MIYFTIITTLIVIIIASHFYQKSEHYRYSVYYGYGSGGVGYKLKRRMLYVDLVAFFGLLFILSFLTLKS